MANTIDPIDINVKEASHPVEPLKDVAEWFETETLELNFGETTGRPSASITLKQEFLAQFLQTGWTIDAVMEAGESGSWVSVGGGKTVTKSQAFYPWEQKYTGFGDNSGWDNDLYRQTYGFAFLWGGGARSNISPVNVSQTENTPAADAPAFWTAVQRIRLKRRRLVAERVMKSMMDSFTNSYNTGRAIEDGRYNEIVSLYKLMLRRNENEGNDLVSGATDLMPLANRLIDSVMASLGEADTSSEEVSQGAIKNREKDVNRQFDNLLAQTKAQMITNGTYNGTVWPSVAAGIERQRSEALDKANEAGRAVKFNAKQSVSNLKASVSAQILATMNQISNASDQRKITATELRNNVLKWMLDYISTRQETHPELGDISTLAERLGFSVGSAGSVL